MCNLCVRLKQPLGARYCSKISLGKPHLQAAMNRRCRCRVINVIAPSNCAPRRVGGAGANSRLPGVGGLVSITEALWFGPFAARTSRRALIASRITHLLNV